MTHQDWDRDVTFGLAMPSCVHCGGHGTRNGRRGMEVPCNCVFRAIFRACYERFRFCAAKEKYISKVSLVPCRGRDRRLTYERLIEDYIADFCLVSKRHLSDLDYRIFRYHFLLGADWRLCCSRLGIDRGNFFHAVYRIQQRLGRVFKELQPYGLYPVDEYFAGRVERNTSPPPPEGTPHQGTPVRPPLRDAA
ncbi:MAG: hypothetical protein IPM24_17625 [Bryobacterales bacterium]|nr:hypothetical protein [Bryobacterales bacterium]